MRTMESPSSTTRTEIALRRWTNWWPAIGPAVLAALLAGRTLLGDGLAPAIGLSVSAVLLGAAAISPRRDAWTVPGLLLGPIALLTTPAATELSFNLSRPDDRGWFALTIGLAIASGLCIAAAVTALTDRRMVHLAAPVIAGLGAIGFAGLLVTLDPQPDLGRDLDATTRANLPEVQLLNFAYGLPSEALVVESDGTMRLRARFSNPSDLPHTFTIDDLDVDVYVPAGRSADVDVEIDPFDEPLRIHCTIGDHTELGMVARFIPLS
jgi:hypothetical protein